MNTEFTLHGRTLSLRRYPAKSQHVSLQAWDSADEYIINHLADNPQLKDLPKIILNDDFGALASCFHRDDDVTDSDYWYSDSKVAELALQQNWQKNIAQHCHFSLLNKLDPQVCGVRLAILKLPKNNHFLIEQLIYLRKILPQGSLVITAGKANQIAKSTLSLYEKHLGNTHTSLAVKKSRLIFTEVDNTKATQSRFPLIWQANPSGVNIYNLANVFSAMQMDIGARFLLDHLPNVQNKRVVDLGCGNGILSAHLLSQEPAELHCVDDSAMAVESASQTIKLNDLATTTKAFFWHSNCMEQVDVNNVDLVLCNPPFHQQNTITDHIAWQMFHDAKQALRVGGELRIVGNRHLGYHEKLKRLFGGSKVVASNKKFVILSSIKR